MTCLLTNAQVLPARRETLDRLIHLFFRNRTVTLLDGWTRNLHLRELDASLRPKSAAYDTATPASRAPNVPLELGYLRLERGTLDVLGNPIPVTDPERFAHILGEFLEPGATLSLQAPGQAPQRWQVVDDGQVVPWSDASGPR
ncbi:MAG: hypothetical protein AAF970_05025 [Bacteroidota bacterium]